MVATPSSWQPDALMGAARKAVRFDDRWLQATRQAVFQSDGPLAAGESQSASTEPAIKPEVQPADPPATATEHTVAAALPGLLDDVAEALSDFEAQARLTPDGHHATGSSEASDISPSAPSNVTDAETTISALATTVSSDPAWVHLGERMASALEALAHNPEQQFEPLKKLALHLACELVRSELHVSSSAIDALVRHCLDDLSASGQSVVVELHPEDARMAQPWIDQWPTQAQVKEDASLSRGSVRVSGMGTVVEDLIENRLQNLARSLGVEIVDLQAAPPSSGEVVDA